MDNWQALLDYWPRVLTALGILIFSVLLARLLEKMLHHFLERNERTDRAAIQLLGQIARWTILILGGLAALNQFVNVTAFIAGLGVAGLAIGFALQDILQNLMAGLILLLQRPFDIGESVEISGEGGTVLQMDLRATELQTWDGRILIIPNASILNANITNYSRAPRRRVDVPIGIGYGDDPETARQALLDAIRQMHGVLETPAPSVRFQSFGESSVDLTLYFWIDTSQTDIFQARDQAVVRAKAALDAAGVDIPYPIRTIQISK